jgi:hypothetical protein
MTDKQFERAKEIKNQLQLCNNMLSFEKDNNVIFANNFCRFIQKDLFDVVKKKKAELEREYSEL